MSQDVLDAGTKKIKFKCGCVLDPATFSFDNIPLDCSETWKLVATGYTKGVFQIEKNLGKRYSEEVKPESVEELSDLVSLIRPGCLEAEFREKPEDPGKFSSITNTYIKVKDGKWEPEYIDPVLEPIFEATRSVPIYQEQIMRICTDFAGFNLQEADVARKAVGKKKKDVMEKVKEKFIAGAIKMGHEEGLAETIFGWIEKFSGYGFNKSHGVSYAMIGYQTAYAKRHFPLKFFKAMLTNSDGKQDSLEEIQELVFEARKFGVEVNPPNLKLLNLDFEVNEKDNSIAFGLGHIKGVGKSAFESLRRVRNCRNPEEFLVKSFKKGTKVRKGVAEALIKSGALDYMTPNRIGLLCAYKIMAILTEREQKFIAECLDNGDTFNHAFHQLLDSKIPNKSRKPRIIAAVEELEKALGGNKKKMAIAYERHYLGIPLSGSLVELYANEYVNIKCTNFQRLRAGSQGSMGVVIEKIKRIKDRRGNWMCFLTVSDETYMLDCIVVFSSYYNKISWILEEGKPLLISGKKDKRGSFLVNHIEHL